MELDGLDATRRVPSYHDEPLKGARAGQRSIRHTPRPPVDGRGRLMRGEAISVRGLTRRFGRKIAVEALDLDVERGQIFGFLGPNGAGKTTTIRMLTGILRPSVGSGRVAGYDLVREPELVKWHIGYMAQHFGLYDDLTATENLRFYARVYGAAEPRVLERLIERYGFSEHRDVLARDLSGGFRQRLALICALTHAPSLLFLDEPTAGVDPAVRKELWDLFYELADGGTTLFVTTHYMEEAERCDRLAFIDRGRLVAEDTPEGIRALLTDKDVFVVQRRYDPRVVARAREAAGVDMVSQFGATLRLVCEKDRYDERDVRALLGLAGDREVVVVRDRPTIEDVFVLLTQKHWSARHA
jgi:ABC-2 type transport system ATP-binding protein